MAAQLTTQFIEGLYYAICQKQATNMDVASILASAKSIKDAVHIIRKLPRAEVFFNQFNGLSCNWMDNLLCIGEAPSQFQAITLAYAGINRFVDVTDVEQEYTNVLPDSVACYKTKISNDQRNGPEPIELAARAVLTALSDNQRVYLHCQSGFCRSAIIASVVMAARMNRPYSEGLKLVKQRRPIAQPSVELFSAKDAATVIENLRNDKNFKM